jgi:hypothetical protein
MNECSRCSLNVLLIANDYHYHAMNRAFLAVNRSIRTLFVLIRLPTSVGHTQARRFCGLYSRVSVVGGFALSAKFRLQSFSV